MEITEKATPAPVAIRSNSLFVQIPGDIDDDNLFISFDQQHELQQIGALIVQQILIPVLHHQLRNQNSNLPVSHLLLLSENMLHDRLNEKTVRRLDRDQLGFR